MFPCGVAIQRRLDNARADCKVPRTSGPVAEDRLAVAGRISSNAAWSSSQFKSTAAKAANTVVMTNMMKFRMAIMVRLLAGLRQTIRRMLRCDKSHGWRQFFQSVNKGFNQKLR